MVACDVSIVADAFHGRRRKSGAVGPGFLDRSAGGTDASVYDNSTWGLSPDILESGLIAFLGVTY